MSRKGGGGHPQIHSKQKFLGGTDASPLLCGWSTALIVREEPEACSFFFFFYERRPEIIPSVGGRRETCSAAVTVTEVLSWGREVGGPAAGRSVPGCGCSRGGRSGSGGPRVGRGRGNSGALGGEEMNNTMR